MVASGRTDPGRNEIDGAAFWPPPRTRPSSPTRRNRKASPSCTAGWTPAAARSGWPTCSSRASSSSATRARQSAARAPVDDAGEEIKRVGALDRAAVERGVVVGDEGVELEREVVEARAIGGCLRDGARSYAKTVKGTALPGLRRRPAGRDHQLPGSDPEPDLDAVAHR